MQCPKCGAQTKEGEKMCCQCGAKLSDKAADSAPRRSGLAVSSLILGILTITPILGGLFALAAVILGIIALIQIPVIRPRVTGKGFAIAGIALASVLVFLIYFPTYLESQIRSKVQRARSELRILAKALASYAGDNKAYPPITSLPQPGKEWKGTTELWLLTTPVAHISELPKDPFSSNEEEIYVYVNLEPGLSPISEEKRHPLSEKFGAWILVSAGPDENLDLDLLSIADDRSGATFCNTIYDPTNGTIGGGDILISQKAFSSYF